MDASLVLLRSCFVYAFFIFLAFIYAGLEPNKENARPVALFSLGELAMAIVITRFLGAEKINYLYPLFVHVPAFLLFYLWGKVRPLKALSAILTSYLCCEFPNWIAKTIAAIFGGAFIVEVISYAITASLLTIVFKKYVSRHVSSLLSYSTLVCVTFSLVPSGYYVWSYIMTAFPNFVLRHGYHSTLTTSALFALMFVLFAVVVNKRQEDELALRELLKKKQEEENEKLIAVEANKSKDEFLAAMSHEIRTPINAILGFDEILLREAADPATKDYAGRIKLASLSLLNLINDVLDWSKIESGYLKLTEADYEPGKLLADVLLMTEPRAVDKSLKLNYEIDPRIPKKLYGDDVRIKQIVMNLLTNAVKYTKEGQVTLRVAVKERMDNRVKLHFSVMDTGIGIKDEDKGKLFDSFKRLDPENNRSVEGTGLGLSITLRLLTLMDSTLSFDSVYGKGSDFYFDLWQEVRDNEEMGLFSLTDVALNQLSVYRETFTAPDANILVVDDNDMNLIVFKGLMQNSQMNIDTAQSGAEALTKIKNNKYDMVFMDHLMPKMDGIECLRKIVKDKNLTKNAGPVVVLTANALSGAKEEYIKAGFADYLKKPIVGYEIEDMIRKYLPEDMIHPILVEVNSSGSDSLSSKDVESLLYNGALEESEIGSLINDQGLDESTLGQSASLSEDSSAGAYKGSKTMDDVILPKPAEVVSSAPVDFRAGLSLCGGNKELYKNMLEAFIETDFARKLEKPLHAKDFKEYEVEVHGLKSGAKSIGADSLSEIAKESEYALKDDRNDVEFVKFNHSVVLEGLRITEEEIKGFLARQNA